MPAAVVCELGAPAGFRPLAGSRAAPSTVGTLLYLYEAAASGPGARAGLVQLLGRLGELAQLAPTAEPPFFFSQIGRTFPPEGERKHKGGLSLRVHRQRVLRPLNEATVRVLQRNGCEVVVPSGQGCCGALHLHAGLRGEAQKLACRNIDALLGGGYNAIITNAAGCGSTSRSTASYWKTCPSTPKRLASSPV